MDPRFARVASVTMGFKERRNNPLQRDRFSLRRKAARYRGGKRPTPLGQMNLNGKVIGKDQALDYLAMRAA